MKNHLPNLFLYADYRQFIKDYIAVKKDSNSKYSFRYYSRRAGFSSTNFLSLVVKGHRNLSSTSIGKIAKGFGLNKQEWSFFENLVLMNQACSHEEKDLYYQRIIKSKPFSEFKEIDKSCYHYFSQWYNLVIRELVEYMPQPLNYKMVARIILPPITISQAKRSIELLLSLGLIEEYENGKYRKAEAVITTGSEIQSIQVTKFHKQMAKLAIDAIDTQQADQRDISGIVMSVNHDRMADIKKKIIEFRNELAEMAIGEENENQVVYVQISAFPLTAPLEDT
jgi:uncharacterized protein (TIGR02147 family)